MECYAGFDLSSTSDITSVSYAFPFDREIRLLTRHYLPEAQLLNVANKNRTIYRQWVNAGWIRTTPGDCIDYDRIRDDILRDAEKFSIRLVGFDTWNATHLRTQLQGRGSMWSLSSKLICGSARLLNLLRCSLTVRYYAIVAIRFCLGYG